MFYLDCPIDKKLIIQVDTSHSFPGYHKCITTVFGKQQKQDIASQQSLLVHFSQPLERNGVVREVECAPGAEMRGG